MDKSEPTYNVGFESVPSHYEGEREAIDVIRDILGKQGFISYCWGNMLKYKARAGKKGDYEEDYLKAKWYTEMLLHVQGQGPDPRRYRKDFVPYTHQGDGKHRDHRGRFIKTPPSINQQKMFNDGDKT